MNDETTGRRRQLEAAYRAAHYRVEAPAGEFNLRLGRRCSELARLYLEHALTTAVYVTASNPASCQLAESQNRQANTLLWHHLQAIGKPVFSGYAIDPEGKWPPEASFLVLGMAIGEAATLGRAYGQSAIVVAGAEAVPELVWLEPETPARASAENP